MLEDLPNELLHKILDNLSIYEILKMLLVSEKVRLKIEDYKIKLVFVNNIVKKNTFAKAFKNFCINETYIKFNLNFHLLSLIE